MRKKTSKDQFQAKLAFILSLGFWIPLFNVGLSFAAIVVAIKSLQRMNQSEKHGGTGYAVAALAIGGLTFITSIIFVGIFMFRRITCEVACSLI